jgi:hypothetical protein
VVCQHHGDRPTKAGHAMVDHGLEQHAFFLAVVAVSGIVITTKNQAHRLAYSKLRAIQTTSTRSITRCSSIKILVAIRILHF